MIDLKDWNDINTKEIPLDVELFALIGTELKPEVIIARTKHAEDIRWAKPIDKINNNLILCYDVPCGGYYSCKGSDIKYWKEINKPKFYIDDDNLIEKIKNNKDFDSYEKEYLTDLCKSNIKGE